VALSVWFGPTVTGPSQVDFASKPSIKADTWIVCFVQGALGRKPSSDEAKRLLCRVATQQDFSTTALDHAVWQYARKTGRRKLGCS